MRQKPSVLIRPLEHKDLRLLSGWKRLPGWPRSACSVIEGSQSPDHPEALRKRRDWIMIAWPSHQEPIGLAHLSAKGLPEGVAQYSVAIPAPQDRCVGRGRDLILLSIGAAFFVYGLRQIFSLIESDNSSLIKACENGGFQWERDFSFLGLDVMPASLNEVYSASPESWMPIWGEELAVKGVQVPWLRTNASWEKLLSMCKTVPDESEELVRKNMRAHHVKPERLQPESSDHLELLPPRKVLA